MTATTNTTWTVGSYAILATDLPGDESAVYRVYLVDHSCRKLFGDEPVISGHDPRFYSDSQHGRRTLLAGGWVGPFATAEEARAALASR